MRYFNPNEDVSITKRKMPHWEQNEALYFVTFRLGDALPAKKLNQWKNEKTVWIKRHPEPWSEAEHAEYSSLFQERIDVWLNAGNGSCIFKSPEFRVIVQTALHHFDGQRYNLFDYVIMPNHVHLLVQTIPDYTLSNLLHTWKSFTAHEVNRCLNRRGTLWQDESYDHLVRSEAQLFHYRNYITENPRKAKLRDDAYTLRLLS